MKNANPFSIAAVIMAQLKKYEVIVFGPFESDIPYFLRGEVYGREKGWETPDSLGREIDKHDKSSMSLVAYEKNSGKPVGTARLTLAVGNALPHEWGSGEEIEIGRTGIEIGRLAVLKDHRGMTGCTILLMANILGCLHSLKVDDAFFLTTAALAKKLKRLGMNLTKSGESVWLNGERIPFKLDVDEVSKWTMFLALASSMKSRGKLASKIARLGVAEQRDQRRLERRQESDRRQSDRRSGPRRSNDPNLAPIVDLPLPALGLLSKALMENGGQGFPELMEAMEKVWGEKGQAASMKIKDILSKDNPPEERANQVNGEAGRE